MAKKTIRTVNNFYGGGMTPAEKDLRLQAEEKKDRRLIVGGRVIHCEVCGDELTDNIITYCLTCGWREGL